MSAYFQNYDRGACGDRARQLVYVKWPGGQAPRFIPQVGDGHSAPPFNPPDWATLRAGWGTFTSNIDFNTGLSIAADAGSLGCYDALAFSTAVLIGRERNDRLRATGKMVIPEAYSLSEVNAGSMPWLVNLARDYFYALRFYYEWDQRQYYGTDILITQSADGIPMITPELQSLRELAEQLILVKQRDDATINTLTTLGVDPKIIRDISARTATDPLGRFILERIVKSVIPGDAPVIDSGIPANTELPVSDSNALSQIEEQNRLLFLAQSDVDARTIFYSQVILRENKDQSEARDYWYWSKYAPSFELIPSHNQHVSAAILARPWPQNTEEIPPLVNLTVTPQGLDRPEVGWLASNMSWLGPVIKVVIPVVGTVIAAGLSVQAASEMKNFAHSWSVPTSAFSPQYKPVTPFDIVLPLNLAQYVIAHPAYGPAICQLFTQTLATGDMIRIHDLLTKFFGPPPASATGTADSLKPLAVTMQEINTGRAIQPGDLVPVTAYDPPAHISEPVTVTTPSTIQGAIDQLRGNGSAAVSPLPSLTNPTITQTPGTLTGSNPAGAPQNLALTGSLSGNLAQTNLSGQTGTPTGINTPAASAAPAAGGSSSGVMLLAVGGLAVLFLMQNKK